MKLKQVKIDDISIGDRFRQDLGDLSELSENIVDQGVIQPITVDENLLLIAGGRRLAAAKSIGLEKIPCIIRSEETELNLREIELAENIHRKNLSWQERAALEERIHSIKREADPEWSEKKTADLLDRSETNLNRHIQLAKAIKIIPDLAECKTEEEAWKKLHRIQNDLVAREIAKRASSHFQWAWLDNHYTVKDAIEGMKEKPDGICGFAEVDPPYGIDLKGKREKIEDDHDLTAYNEISNEDYPAFCEAVAGEVYRLLRDNSFCVWWYGPSHHSTVLESLRKVGFSVSDIPAIWCKGMQGQANNPEKVLANAYEPFFIARKGSPLLKKPGRVNTFHFSPVPHSRKIHPTERPLELMTELLDTFHHKGIFVSPFLGSGAILRAAYRKELSGFGFDLAQENKDRFIAKAKEELKHVKATDEKEEDDGDNASAVDQTGSTD